MEFRVLQALFQGLTGVLLRGFIGMLSVSGPGCLVLALGSCGGVLFMFYVSLCCV